MGFFLQEKLYLCCGVVTNSYIRHDLRLLLHSTKSGGY